MVLDDDVNGFKSNSRKGNATGGGKRKGKKVGFGMCFFSRVGRMFRFVYRIRMLPLCQLGILRRLTILLGLTTTMNTNHGRSATMKKGGNVWLKKDANKTENDTGAVATLVVNILTVIMMRDRRRMVNTS